MEPLDAHAHISPSISLDELDNLGACIFAVTRTTTEFRTAQRLAHPTTLWGLGAHPSVRPDQILLDSDFFAKLVLTTPLIGEVGLDGRSSVDMTSQVQTLVSILEIVALRPRLISVHSSSATGKVLEVLESCRPKGVLLHWWRGTVDETRRALNLGCFFSINPAQTKDQNLIRTIPRDRILSETDHPFGDRSNRERYSSRPGEVSAVEAYLAQKWHVAREEVRHQIWQNLLAITRETETIEMFPSGFQRNLMIV
jgi:TatD DNase family protein